MFSSYKRCLQGRCQANPSKERRREEDRQENEHWREKGLLYNPFLLLGSWPYHFDRALHCQEKDIEQVALKETVALFF
jgi:hypothetical protein